MSGRGVIVITGAGSGIGRATATRLSALGYPLVLVGRRRDALRETASACVGACTLVDLDVAQADSGPEILRRLAADNPEESGIAALLNNAGRAITGTIAESSHGEIASAFAVNAVAPTALVSACWSGLMAHAALHGRATVVNVSSIATMDPFPNLYAYACAKAALNIGALCVHREGRPLGIRGFAVAPGSVETAMLRSVVSTDVLPTEQTLSPDAVAKVIVECIEGARDRESGTTIVVKPVHGV